MFMSKEDSLTKKQKMQNKFAEKGLIEMILLNLCSEKLSNDLFFQHIDLLI